MEPLEVEFDFANETKNFYVFEKPRNRAPEMFPHKIYVDRARFQSAPKGIKVKIEAL